jgi:hypothetical protein
MSKIAIPRAGRARTGRGLMAKVNYRDGDWSAVVAQGRTGTESSWGTSSVPAAPTFRGSSTSRVWQQVTPSSSTSAATSV